jgi:beta-glucosidase
MTTSSPLPQFPESFLWGTSTSAFQIEGAPTEDGKGVSIWDTFTARPGAVRDAQKADVAVDEYHRFAEDLELMAGLGVNAYRFSIAWTRVQPDGSGPANAAGLAYYDRLVDGLLERGIAPLPTLFHWDLPQALEDKDGWLERDTAHRLADYAGLVAEALADRVERWITLNEPFVHMVYGYALGIHAPGRTLMTGAFPAAHHQLLGHGLATSALRAHGVRQVLIANNCTPVWPASDAEADLRAAEAYDVLHNRLFNDPILLGRYPDLSAYGVAPAASTTTTRRRSPLPPGRTPPCPGRTCASKACPVPPSTGRWCRTACARCWCGCAPCTATRSRRSTSPRTGRRALTSSSTAAWTTRRASTTSTRTSGPWLRRWPRASTCAAT